MNLPASEAAPPRADASVETANSSVITRSLGSMALGDRAVVESLAIERPVARRLMELGLLPGTVVELVRRAPLGDPLEISLRGYHLSLRKSEAARVIVRPLSP